MKSVSDLVRIKDRIVFSLGRKLGEYLIANEHHIVPVSGYLTIFGEDERGRAIPGTRREGQNVVTQTGREWLARLMSYRAYTPALSSDTPERNDRIRYIGLGSGAFDEVPGVSALQSPLAFNIDGNFLAELTAPATYGLASSTSEGTSVRYSRTFTKDQISVNASQEISEAGLFTDGSPESSYAPRTRNVSLEASGDQPPMFYKSFEPFTKTQKFAVTTRWDVRF